jgi:hypothetical protein
MSDQIQTVAFESEAEWSKRRATMQLAYDEQAIRIWDLDMHQLEAYIARRKAGLQDLLKLHSCRTPANFVAFARKGCEGVLRHHEVIADARIGFSYLYALEKNALYAAEIQLNELHTREALRRFGFYPHPDWHDQSVVSALG